ncbi:MAG TPA: carboxypeptidase-like regulatory domain-containing protein [Bryobacteraceae bacterium]|nr:carboxypeptidase-like regulatory domain-containing protein [Bryobacteraceae bacterium]
MRIVWVVLGIFLVCVAIWAQATAQIAGTVHDESGAAVAGADVKVTQTATGAVRTVTSGRDGGYVLPNLALGPYLLEVSKEGFTKYVQSGIVLQVDSNPTIDVALKVGAVTEQVTVEASASQVESHSTGVGQVVDNQRVAEMPLNGRDPHELVFLAGMSSSPGNGAINTVRNYPTVVVSVAGGQGNGVGYSLDGAIFQDPYNNLSLPLPFPDALQEFKVETSALPPQYGYHSTATVNAVTKSGSNEFHGDLFEFIRNGDLNARDFFALTRDSLKRNQYGGVIGGAIIKDKLFFFGGYQRTSQRSDPSALTGYVPTAAELRGDFTFFASAACQGKNVTLSAAQGFTGNQISPASFSPVALNLVKTLPTATDGCGTVKYGFLNNSDEDLPVGRIDWQVNSKHSVFGRFNAGNLNSTSTFDGKDPLSVNNDAVHDLDYQLALGDTYLIGSSLVNSFRLSASRTNIVKIPDHYASWADFGANYTPIGGQTLLTTVSGGLGFVIGSTGNVPGQSHNGPNPSVSDDVSWVKGDHEIGFGGNLYRQMMNYWSGLNAVGNSTFNGTVTGLGMADFLLGQATSFSQGTTYGFYNRQYYASLYVQDSWKITRKLTVNYGVRWEPYLSQYSKNGQIHDVVPSLFASGYHSPVYSNAPAGVIFPGDPNYACGNSFSCNDWHKFFPRLGIAYDPKGDGKMVIRAAFGQFGDRSHMFYPNVMSFGPPFGDLIGLANVKIDNPWAAYPGGNPIPGLISQVGVGNAARTAPFPLSGAYVNFPTAGFHPMYVNQWNVSIQKQVGSWLLTANYLGNTTIHLVTSTALNPAVFLGLGPCTLNTINAAGQIVPTNFSTCSTTANQNFRRVLFLQNPQQGAYYASIAQALDSGTASYNAFYLAANKALTHGITLNTNYTLSHCITDPYDQQTGQSGLTPPGNRRAYRGNCPLQDQRHTFVLNAVMTAPKISGGLLRIVASDWQLAPILQIRSGQAFTVTAGTDQALNTVAGQTAVQLLPDPYSPNKSIKSWLNPAAFAVPALGTTSTLGYGNVYGPPMFQLNVALSRTFRLHERQSLQFRAEAFNLPNTLNPNNPTAGGGSTAARNSGVFGVIQSDISTGNGLTQGDYRVVQLAAKFVF